jgi:murein DD-endopeptidase MepM/ murein hydrolase activator NlpD
LLNRIAVATSVAVSLSILAAAAGFLHHPGERLGQDLAVTANQGVSPVAGEVLLTVEEIAAAESDPAGSDTADSETAGGLTDRTVSLDRGETLMELLLRAELPRDQAHAVVAALKPVHDPRRFQAGQSFVLRFDTGDSRFVGLEFDPAADRSVSVSFDNGRYQAAAVRHPLEKRLHLARGRIETSLYQAGSQAGLPAPVMHALINKLFNYEVDFQRDLQPGDEFEVLFEQYLTDSGVVARTGDIQFAALTLSGKRRELYRFGDDGAPAEYFTGKGSSVRKALLKTPVDGARLTSGFGMRMHPVLGFSKMHRGVDFGAAPGTPIYAAGTGVVDEAGSKGAYGNYVRIRHSGDVSTAYAHMSRFGTGVRRGARVAQGDIIGYVGSTGRTTGPHLHYEVLLRDRQVNPGSVTLPAGRTLEGRSLKLFQDQVASVQALLAARTTDGAATIDLVSSPARKEATR